jgi:D-alanine-D-alanine ligase-like ATP-grasp enzyme
LTALAVILAMDKDLSAAAEALRNFVPNAGCLRYHDVRLRHGVVTLIDDSYNATVTSMHNAFQVLAEATPPARGRKIAVLGRIVHLGDLAQPLHEELAQPLLATGVEQVITHGPEMRFLRAQLPADRLGPHCSQAQEVVRHLHNLAQDGDLILIKGSRRASDFGEILRLLSQPERQDAEQASSGIPAPLSRSAPPPSPSRPPASVYAFTEDLLLQAAARRNLKITRHPAGYVEIAQHGRGAIFRRNSPDHSVLAATITADKRRTKQLLDLNGLPTQNGAVFGNLQSAQAFFIRFQAEHTDRARHVRVMVLGGRAVGAYECVPITLTGNGRDTVALTETIHASLLTLAEQAVHCFPGLHLAGVSLLCEDPERDLASQRAVILDIDGKPAIADLAFPASGPALDLSNEVLDYALDPARQQTPSDQPPCLRPAPPFTPAADTVFALDSRLEVQLLRHAARSRGLKAERLSSKLTRIADEDSQCLFYRTMSPGTRIVARRATNTHKSWAKQLLRAAGLPTPNGQAFAADQQATAWAYLQPQGVPAVIKPQSGSWGRGVTTNVTQREHFDDAWTLAVQTKATSILVEEYVPGTLYRLFVVGNTLVAAAEILPAQITGDGQQSIQSLVDAQNLQREQDPGLAQCPIVLGPSVLRQLQAQGLNPNAIPDAGRTVQLDTVANTGVGGTSQDVTERVHPDFAPLAVKARRAVFDPPHVGIDLVAEDISLPPDKQAWSIIEVNTNPDLSLHHFPTVGQPRDVAGTLIEHIFTGHA